MHAFSIISSSENDGLKEIEKILSDFQISKFRKTIINKENCSVKDLRKQYQYLSLNTDKRSYQALIISNINLLSLAASQSLLKIVEEPPQKTIIILRAFNHSQILPTLLSRSKIIYIPSLENINEEESKKIMEFWVKIIRNNKPGELLVISSALTSDIDNWEAYDLWLIKQIIFFRNLSLKRLNLAKSANILTPQHINIIIRKLLEQRKLVSNNINLKMLADNLFLDIPKLTA